MSELCCMDNRPSMRHLRKVKHCHIQFASAAENHEQIAVQQRFRGHSFAIMFRSTTCCYRLLSLLKMDNGTAVQHVESESILSSWISIWPIMPTSGLPNSAPLRAKFCTNLKPQVSYRLVRRLKYTKLSPMTSLKTWVCFILSFHRNPDWTHNFCQSA